MTFVSYAQNCEDVMLWRALGHVRNGFYIDVGAAHPDIDSVTRAFYEHGWRGINIEPVPADAARLAASRPGDITLQLAAGGEDGEAGFLTVPGTGLSTLDSDAAAAPRVQDFASREGRVGVRTLASICRAQVRGEIHFLKIDVEGAEADVLAGAELATWRPWIIVVEATAPRSAHPTHAEWEPALIEQGYRFAWFDGLNRFYLAEEHADALAPHFRTPPNVFDDFIRANDTVWTERVTTAETRAALVEQSLEAERSRAAEAARPARMREEAAEHELARLRSELAEARYRAMLRDAASEAALHFSRHELQQAHLRLQAALQESHERGHALEHTAETLARAHHQLHHTTLALDEAQSWLAAVRRSRLWRLGGPIRVVARALKPVPPPPPPPVQPPPALPAQPVVARTIATPPAPMAPVLPAVAAPVPPASPAPAAPTLQDAPQAPAMTAPTSRPRRAVHQFHSGSAAFDAITNAMLLTRAVLRGLGYDSEIFVAYRDPGLAETLRTLDELPAHDDYVLIVRHSMGFDSFARIAALAAPKILLYHDITPSSLLGRQPSLAAYADLGRRQLAALRGHVHAALADSEYTAVELRQLGFEPVRACPMLFDIDVLRARAAATQADRGGVFTILFVGRINPSKDQLALIAAYNAFRTLYHAPSRLVLVGRDDGPTDPYAAAVGRAIASSAAPSAIVRTGLVGDDERDAWYGRADLYVSLSRHEGFGVPLVEAMAHGVAILALPTGAVPYTLGDAATLLPEAANAPAIAALIDALARDPGLRAAMAERARASLDRFDLAQPTAILAQALLRAGAALPPAQGARQTLAANLHFAVTGHVNSSYSLAAINRSLALTLEAACPNRVRLIPVEGVFTTDLSDAPAADAPAIAALAQRPAPLSAPELIISQHYPVHVPPRASGQIRLALLFWEESLLPPETIATLEGGFDGVVAPTRFVAKALQDSGLRLPVRVIAHQPSLSAFLAVRGQRRPDATLTFLHVSSGFPRKGADILLRAWAAAFAAHDPVRLLIKSFPNRHNTIADDLDALRAEHPDLAAVELIEADLDEAALAALYARSDVMVLPSRGEGYNLPAAEALAAGLRLIVTGAGGHMDFCQACDPRVRLLRYRHALSTSHLATPHSLWLEPDPDDLVGALRDAVSTEASAETWVEPGAEPIPPAIDIAGGLSGFGLDLLLQPPTGPVRIAWVSSWGQRCGIAEYSRLLLESLEPDPMLAISVLCDRRTPDFAPLPGRPPHLPCWDLGGGELDGLLAAIGHVDAQAVVVQHQPGLIEWPHLARLIEAVAARGRIVAVTLHSTRDLLEQPRALRHSVIAALSRADRVVVHTRADLDLLTAMEAGLGLGPVIENRLTMVPHGIAAPRPMRAARALTGTHVPMIGCYGFFLRGKGIDTLIRASVLLRQRWPTLQLRLVNAAYGTKESEAELARCRVLAEPLGGAAQFHTRFLPQEESLALLGECDLVVLPHGPSREAFSGALCTALTAGTAVAVNRIALFDEADAAVLRVDASTAETLARDLDVVLQDASGRERAQRQAAEWIRARAWPLLARRFASMLTGLVRSSQVEP